MDKKHWIQKLKEEILELTAIEKVIRRKNPSYPFLWPTLDNSVYAMANLLTYLEGTNPHFAKFDENFFLGRNTAMHRAFLQDLHINTEDGLREIINEKQFKIVISRQKQIKSIVDSITKKVSSPSVIETELKKVADLGGSFATFNDYLNTVLNNISLDEEYVQDCRTYFDGFNIVRNKMAHSDMELSENEKVKLKAAKLGNIITPDGKNMQMTFEGYKLLISDIIRFFDHIHACL